MAEHVWETVLKVDTLKSESGRVGSGSSSCCCSSALKADGTWRSESGVWGRWRVLVVMVVVRLVVAVEQKKKGLQVGQFSKKAT